jgi:hypothetical protein
MAESYWESAARGAAPNMGMASHVNPLAYSSPTTPFNPSAGGSSYSTAAPATFPAAAARNKSPTDLAVDLRKQYKDAYGTARNDNIARYDQGMKMHDDLYKRTFGYTDPRNNAKVPGYWDTFGENQKAAIAAATKNNAAQTQAAAMDRGIYNTSTALNQLGTAKAEGDRLLADVEAKRAEGKTNSDVALTNEKLGFLERRTDSYPDYDRLVGMEKMRGSGSLEGIGGYDGGFGGGGGGAAMGGFAGIGGAGYGFGGGGGGGYAGGGQAPAQDPRKEQLRQLSYEAKRLGFKTVQEMMMAKSKGVTPSGRSAAPTMLPAQRFNSNFDSNQTNYAYV